MIIIGYILLLFLLGTLVWSTVLCYIQNFWEQEKFIKWRSRCDHCKKQLKAVDLIPLVSYITRKGQCRYCHTPLKSDYIMYEFIFGIIFALVGAIIVYYRGWMVDSVGIYNTLWILINVVWSSCLVLSDAKYQMVDIKIVILALLSNLLLLMFWQGFGGDKAVLAHILNWLLLYVGGWYIIFVLGKIIYRIKHQHDGHGFGIGDIRVMSYIAVMMYQLYWDQYDSSMYMVAIYMCWLILACILGIIYRFTRKNKEEKIPFVPCMLASVLIMSILSKYVLYLYQAYFSIR